MLAENFFCMFFIFFCLVFFSISIGFLFHHDWSEAIGCFILTILLFLMALVMNGIKKDNIAYWKDNESRQADLDLYLTELEIFNNDTSNFTNEKVKIMLEVMDEYNSLLEQTLDKVNRYNGDTTPYKKYGKLYYNYSTDNVEVIPDI